MAGAENRRFHSYVPDAPTPSPILTSVAAHLYVRDLKVSTEFFTKKLAFAIDFVYGDLPFYDR